MSEYFRTLENDIVDIPAIIDIGRTSGWIQIVLGND